MNAATLDFIQQHAQDDVRQLALRTAPAEVDLRTALTQIEGRQLAARKIPTWAATDGLLFPPRLAMEQCSSEATARYKQVLLREKRPEDASFIDLTAGFGVDFAAIAPLFTSATYVDKQEELCRLARHNLPLLGCTKAKVCCTSAEEMLDALAKEPQQKHVLMIDPARRDAAGRKVALIEDCTPDVCRLQEQLRALADYTLIKLSPMLDVTAAVRALQGIEEVHIVSVEGECKELLLVMTADSMTPSAPAIHCVNLPSESTFTFQMAEEEAAVAQMAEHLCKYLYEPNASILKAGAFKTICKRYPVCKLSPEAHLYTSDQFIANFPGRRWHILDHATFNKKELKRLLAGITAADLTVRGFPMPVAALRRQLRLSEGGQHHLIATTLARQKCLLRVERILHHEP